MLDLFSAGAESVSNSLDYSLLYLILNPDIQKKVQEELDAVVGRNRRPSLEDRPRYEQSEESSYESLLKMCLGMDKVLTAKEIKLGPRGCSVIVNDTTPYQVLLSHT